MKSISAINTATIDNMEDTHAPAIAVSINEQLHFSENITFLLKNSVK